MEAFRDTCNQDGAIRAATFFGSAVDPQRISRRSDVDALVICQRASEMAVLRRMNDVCTKAAATHVPLNVHVLSDELARTDVHDISGTLRTHLERIQRNTQAIIKGDVLGYIAPHYATAEADLVNYASAKICKLKNGLARYGAMDRTERVRFLQKCLEAPVQVARKHLEALSALDDDDTKTEVLRRYRKVAPKALIVAFEQAAAGDIWYNIQLERHLCRFEEAVYTTVLEHLLERFVPTILTYVHAVLMLCAAARKTDAPS